MGVGDPMAPRPCTAHSKQTGAPCKRNAVPGATVCHWHGGAAPQVQAKARQRILEAADRVAAELVRIALTGESDSVRVQAARDLLDRAGLSAKVMLEATVTTHDGDAELDRAIEALLERMAANE
jgi:hypothetical protein